MTPLRVLLAVSFSLLVAIPGHAQQIACKDLRHPSPEAVPSPKTPPDRQMPKGCKEMTLTYADGATVLMIPRKIQLELLSLGDEALIIGNEYSATLKLRNVGRDPLTIPWSTDFRTAQEGQDPDNRRWETGQFRLALRNGEDEYVELKDTSQLLYGSEFVPGSILTVKPGEWIAAQIAFRVTERFPRYDRIEEGPADLAVEWLQSGWAHTVKGCEEESGYYPYDDFAGHSNRETVGRVKIKRPDNAENPSR